MSEKKTRIDSSSLSENSTSPTQLKALDELATERLLAAGGAGMSSRRSVLAASESIR